MSSCCCNARQNCICTLTGHLSVTRISASDERRAALFEDDEAWNEELFFSTISSAYKQDVSRVSTPPPSISESQDRDNLLVQLTKSSERTISMFVCPHITNQCQLGVAACRVLRAYRRYSHGASAITKCRASCRKGIHKLRVHYGNDKDFFQPYSEVELISIIKYFGPSLPRYPPYSACTRSTVFWNIVMLWKRPASDPGHPTKQSNDILIECENGPFAR